MPKTASERIAEYRARRKTEGLVTVTLVVPESDAGLFNQFAARDIAKAGCRRARRVSNGSPCSPR